MVRKLIYAFVSIGSVFIVILLAVFLLLATEAGSCWLVHHVSTYVPGQLTIGRIKGSVLSGLSIYEVDQYVDQRHLQIQHVELNWQPMALLGGKILLRSLNIAGITYTVPETKETFIRKAIRPPHDFSIPFLVVVEEAKLNRLHFNQGGTQYSLDFVYLAGRINQDSLWLNRLETQGAGLHINLQSRIRLHHPYPFQAKLNWDTRLSSKVQAQGKCNISGDIDYMEFIHKLNEPLDLDARGEVKIARNLTTKDRTALYDLSLKGDFTGPGLPPTHIKTHVLSDLTIFKVDNLIAHTLGGMVKVNGHIILKPEPKGELTVSAIDIDPGLQWTEWPGKLAFDAKVEGKFDAGTSAVLLHDLKLVGHLIDQPLQAAGNLTFHGISQISGDLKIHSGNNVLNMSGTTVKHLDVKFDVDVPNPVSLWPGLKGHLKGRGGIEGTRNSPSGNITFNGNNITYGDYSVKTLYADLVLDSNNKLSSSKVELINMQVDNEVLNSVVLNSIGDFKNHKVYMDIVTPSVHANVEFAGGCYKDTWEAKVNTASFEPAQYGKWRLCNPVNLIVTHTELKPFNACWTHKKSSLYMQGSWNEESGWKVEGDINDNPLKQMIDILKEIFKKEHLRWGKDTRY